jgi:hypothetical protein
MDNDNDFAWNDDEDYRDPSPINLFIEYLYKHASPAHAALLWRVIENNAAVRGDQNIAGLDDPRYDEALQEISMKLAVNAWGKEQAEHALEHCATMMEMEESSPEHTRPPPFTFDS